MLANALAVAYNEISINVRRKEMARIILSEAVQFGIKGATNGRITTTASGADVLISLDDKTKTTLDKVSTIEGELTKTKSDVATTKNNVTTIQNTVNQLSSGKANTALSNLTDEGKNAITGLVDVKSSSTALTVTPETDQSTQKKTFNLALNEAGIKNLLVQKH